MYDHMDTHVNLIILKHGVQSLRHCKFRLLSMCILLPGGRKEVTDSFVRDLCYVARSYL